MTREFERDSVKLHATVINAKFAGKRKESKEGGPSQDARREHRYQKKPIDATNVLKVSKITYLAQPFGIHYE